MTARRSFRVVPAVKERPMPDPSNAQKPEEVEAEVVTDSYAGPAGSKPSDAGAKPPFGMEFLKGVNLPFGLTPGVALGGVFVVLALIVFGLWSAQNSGTRDSAESPRAPNGARVAAAPGPAPRQDLSLPPPSRDVGDAIDLSSGQPYSPPEPSVHAAPASDVAPSIIDSVTGGASGSVAPGSTDFPGSRIANNQDANKAAFDQETQSLARALAAERAQSQEQQAQIADLRARLEMLEAKEGTTSAGRQAAASLALLSLQRVVAAGSPYQTELDILARLLTPGTPAIDRLRPRARDGAPTLTALKLRFEETARAAFVAEAASKSNTTTGGVMSRLESLISARPASPRAGGDPKAVVSRAEDQLDRNDLDKAVKELETLKGPASETFGPWLADARARLTVEAAIEEVNGILLKDYTN
jgi:hypothetical protein